MNICRIFIVALLLIVALTGSVLAAEIWVSPNGSDKNTGTKEQPLATVAMALRKARELRRLK
jgi:Flp pilus assembly protein CpaB